MGNLPNELVIGGDQRFVRRLIGISISLMVSFVCNMGVCDNATAHRLMLLRGTQVSRGNSEGVTSPQSRRNLSERRVYLEVAEVGAPQRRK